MTDILHTLMRAKKVILLSFVLIFSILLTLLAFKKDKYQAQMTFLIRSERVEDLVSADPAQKALQQEAETEEKINSEVALLSSAELLKAVVLDNGLQKPYLNPSGSNQAIAVEQASRDLSRGLVINGVHKSALIQVSYISTDRDQAKAVLDSLSKEYLTQYSKLHNAGGASAFYSAESDALETNLQKALDERAKLLTQSGYQLLPEAQKSSFDRIVSLGKVRDEAEDTLAETSSRLQRVMQQQGSSSDRVTTQRRVAANPALVEGLTTKLVDQQNRLTELRTKFVDADPLVLQLKQQMDDTRASLVEARSIHSEDVTTDVNPIRQALDSQANQLNQTKAGLASRLQEIDHQLADERGSIGEAEAGRIKVEELSRTIKVLEDSVDLYRGRALAANAAEEMDPEKFSNIVEASHPTVPVLPMGSRFNVRTAFLLSLLLSCGIGFMFGWWENREEYDEESVQFPIMNTATFS